MKLEEFKTYIEALSRDELADLGCFCFDLLEEQTEEFDSDPEVEKLIQEMVKLSREYKCTLPVEMDFEWLLDTDQEFRSSMIMAQERELDMGKLFLEKFPDFESKVRDLDTRISNLAKKHPFQRSTVKSRISVAAFKRLREE